MVTDRAHDDVDVDDGGACACGTCAWKAESCGQTAVRRQAWHACTPDPSRDVWNTVLALPPRPSSPGTKTLA